MKKLHPISPQDLAKMGRGGDTMLAHINPQEAAMLKRMGGSGTINPKTGLLEFMFADDNSYWTEMDGGGGGWGDFGGGGGYFDDSFGNDWYDNGSDNFGNDSSPISPVTGGGAIDNGINPDTGAVRMDFTGMAPGSIDTIAPGSLDYGPEAVNMPSGGVYDILNTPQAPVVDFPQNDYTPLDVTPGPLPDWYQDTTVTPDSYTPDSYTPIDTGPSSITDLPYNPPTVDLPPVDTLLPDLTPYTPNDVASISPVTPDNVPEMTITDNRPAVEDVPEMTITDNRPVAPDNIPEMPEMTIVDTRPPVVVPPETPVVEPDVPEITIVDDRPVKPVEPDVPEITIVDDRPVPPQPPEPPVIVPPEPPVIVEPPYVPPEPPVIVEPPYVPPEPPVIVEPPYVPPQPPVVVPPVMPTTGEMINPGFIQPQAFYNTTNPAQSKFFWGGHGPQFATGQGATPFNAQAYNQVAAPNTPWGLGQVAAPLSPAEVQAAINGTYVSRPGTPAATRAEAYAPQTLTAPSYGQVKVGGPVSPTTTQPKSTVTKELYTADQKTAISSALGSDWQSKMDKAALNGDYTTIVDMQRQIDSILNPIYEQP